MAPLFRVTVPYFPIRQLFGQNKKDMISPMIAYKGQIRDPELPKATLPSLLRSLPLILVCNLQFHTHRFHPRRFCLLLIPHAVSHST